MPALENYLTVAEAAKELGITPDALRGAIKRRTLSAVRLDKTSRTNLISRAEVERYRREHLGQRGKRPQADDLTEQQRKQRAYQQAYYQRRKAARQQQPAAEPVE
jgi:excisionase family DNA binding protein